jgi:hypothetical protein
LIQRKRRLVVVFGPGVIIKHQGAIYVRAVDAVTAAKLEKQPLLMTDPNALLAALAEVSTDIQETANLEKLKTPQIGELEN